MNITNVVISIFNYSSSGCETIVFASWLVLNEVL